MMRPLPTPPPPNPPGKPPPPPRHPSRGAADVPAAVHGRLTFPDAKRLVKLLEPHQPMFIEEPVLPGNDDDLREIAASTSIPIAAGERLFTRWQFQELLATRAVRIVQPDLAHAGGISEV